MPAGGRPSISPQDSSYDAIVVGSGFGGAVSACRLAESGRRVLVLERGRRRKGEQFPRFATASLSDWFWSSQNNGLFDLRIFSRIATLSSSGVGGGSHIYANVHIRAPERSFREGWPTGIHDRELAPYYAHVERMLGVQPLPEMISLPKRRAYAQAARNLGGEPYRPNLAVNFGPFPFASADGEPIYIHDPYGLGIDVEQAACLHCGECDIGCRYAAKNTVDLNYLALAEQRHGAVIQPLSEVLAVAPEQGGYRVHYRDRTTFARTSVWAPLVVLAAGTVNTVELLLRCRDEFGLLPKLSPALGANFSGNGDFLCGALNTRERLAPWHGPVITTAVRFLDDREHFYLQEGGFSPELSFLVAAMRPRKGYVDKMLHGLLSNAARLRLFYQEMAQLAREQEAFEEQLPGNDMIFLGMGQDASDGQIRLRRRFGRRPKLQIDWDHARTQPLIDRMDAELRRIATELGGEYVRNPLYALLGRLITVHPLGGCALADEPTGGAATPAGELWHYPGLYVADGAAVPRALGPNPALTISALAERTVAQIVRASAGA